MNVLGVILARGGSKGIPKKNIYMVCGHPLIAYSISAGLGSKHITDLVVSTDSDEIASVAIEYGAKVPFKRPTELSGDKVLSADSLYHAVTESERIYNKTYDLVVELPCVSPLRDSQDIDLALDKLIDTGCDSVISFVSTGEKHPIRLKKIVDDKVIDFCSEYPEPLRGSRRQDLIPEAYIRNGAIYAMTRKTIIEDKNRSGKDSRPYVMPHNRSVNIDEVFDLELVELLISKGRCNNKPQKIKRSAVEHYYKPNKPKILITTPLHFLPDIKEEIIKNSNCVVANDITKLELAELIKDAETLICQPCPKHTIDEEILLGAKKLKTIASTSTGTNHIDKEYCARNNIEVICLKDNPLTKTITASSEFTFNLVLSVVRKMPYAFNGVRAGKWREAEDDFRGIELAGKTLGIIGFGRIGSNNARYAKAFGMRVVAYDPFVNIDCDYVEQKSTYTEVLKESDVLLICVHLNDATKNMVNSKWFECMKEGVYFINTSRGEIIDEEELIKHLESGKIKAAGLDVICGEMSADRSNSKIIKYAQSHDNLIITPHIAGLTYDSEKKAVSIMFDDVLNKLNIEVV